MKRLQRVLIMVLTLSLILTVLSAPAAAYAQVQEGARGSDVSTLQKMLNAVQNANLQVDGIFGPATKAAVRQFQQNNSLSVDGICGPKTWAALEAKYRSLNESSNLTIDLTSSPDRISLGSKFNLTGTISSNYSITYISSEFVPAAGGASLYTQTSEPNTKSVDIKSSIINQRLPFGKLAAGGYYLVISASDSSGSSCSMREYFEIYDSTTPTSTPMPAQPTAPTGCATHSYTSATGDVCTVCGHIYEPWKIDVGATFYAVKNNVPVRDTYYSNCGSVVSRMDQNESVYITKYFYNSLGNLWYETSNNTFIYSENLSPESAEMYTITFDGNGDGAYNIPSDIIVGNNTFSLPTTIPQRDGYAFMGWSSSKWITICHSAGSSVSVSSNTTFYAVWEEASDYNRYRFSVDALKSSFEDEEQICTNQINSVKLENGVYVKNTGLCNISAITTLCNRKLYLDGKGSQSKFTVEDSIEANGCSIIRGPLKDYYERDKHGNLIYNMYGRDAYLYNGGTSGWWSRKLYTNENGTTYTTSVLMKADIDRKKGSSSYEEYLANLLMEHPEGVCLRNKKANHVCVITDFVRDGDSIVFYAQDPVNHYTGVLSGTYLYKNSVGRGDSSIFTNLDAISYLK